MLSPVPAERKPPLHGRGRDVTLPGVDVGTVQHLRRAKDLIDRRFAEPLDLDALAREAGYSRFHFARSFSAAFGESPRSYLTRRRVERAKDLLRGANLTVTEVCMLVGFAGLGSFSARFRKIVGLSPSEFRRQQVEQGGPPPVPGCYLMAWGRPELPDRTRGEAGEPPQA